MQIKSSSAEDYIEKVSDNFREGIVKLRDMFLEKMPAGFEEDVSYGMLNYVVPHSMFPAGYHCDPKLPLPFVAIAAQKHFIAVYHMGLYADMELLEWFTSEYGKRVKGKLDMGKSCLRFKKPESIPYDLIGELMGKMSPEQWIDIYLHNMDTRNRKK